MSEKKLEGALRVLQILFKEALQETPPELANRLVEGYEQGKSIVLIMGVSSYGKNCKTAFRMVLTDDQNWRGLPDTIGGIQ